MSSRHSKSISLVVAENTRLRQQSVYLALRSRSIKIAAPKPRKSATRRTPMDDIIAGVRAFQRDIYPQQWKLYERLAAGQSPEALIITCSDSRVDPQLLTQSEPGKLFELRNAGNLVPRYGGPGGGGAGPPR